MSMINLTLLQAVASLAARRAGEHVLANLHRRGEVNELSRTDVKHKLDIEAQEIALGVLLSAFPDHAVLGEESCDKPLPDSDYRWVVDPIDGTINFFHGLPVWCVSIACQYKGKSVAAAVFAPQMDKFYEATSESPALCNGKVIRVSKTDRLDLSVLQTGADKWDLGEHAFKFMRKIAEISQRPRIYGAAAVDLCLTAEGLTDGYFESGVYIWDVAAAGLILERAGGKCTVMRDYGGYRMSFLGTNAHLHEALKEKIEEIL